jgi:hypothetical protein
MLFFFLPLCYVIFEYDVTGIALTPCLARITERLDVRHINTIFTRVGNSFIS